MDALRREVEAVRQQLAPTGEPSLNDRIDTLTREVRAQAQEMHRRTAWWRGVVAVGVVLVLAVMSGAFLVELRTRAEIADSNRKLCPMVALLIPSTQTGTPTTDYGRQLAAQARILYDAYGCPKRSN